MPLAINPQARCIIELESDIKFYDPADRPRFIYRFLTGAEWLQVADTQDRIEDAADGKDVLQKTYDTVAIGLVGWENIVEPETADPIKFAAEDLKNIVGIHEAMELIVKLLAQRPDFDDKKKLDLPLACNTEESVKDAKDQ